MKTVLIGTLFLIVVSVHVMDVCCLVVSVGATKMGLLLPDLYGPLRVDRVITQEVERVVNLTLTWLRGLAEDKVEPDGLSLVWGDSGRCDERTVLGETTKMKEGSIKVIVGPPCTKSLRVVALLGSYSKIPVVTWAPVHRDVIGESFNDGVLSTFGSYEDMTRAAFAVMRHLKWTKTAILYEKNGMCEYLIEEMRNQYLVENEFVETTTVMVRPGNSSNVAEGLARTKSLTRTILICSSRDTMATVMAVAAKLRMTSGEYMFLYLSFDFAPIGWPSSSAYGLSREQLECVLQLGHFPTMAPYRNVPGNRTADKRHAEAQVKNFVQVISPTQVPNWQYFNDAVIMAVVVLHRVRNKLTLTGYNVTAPHAQTGVISVDGRGVRRSAFHLTHYQHSGHSTVAMVTVDVEVITAEAIDWPGGNLPASSLACLTCSDTSSVIAGSIVSALLLLIVIVGGTIIYRKYKGRDDQQSKDWIVEDKEVKRRKVKGTISTNLFPSTQVSSTGACNGNAKKRLVRMETRGTIGLGSNCSLDKSMLYAPIGNYKDMVVAVKYVRWTHEHLGKKEMLQDINMVKDLSHDNINPFVGACVSSTPGATYVLFRYCPKGSLQDVLENDDIRLDWMFKLSFALDLARGMEYLHKTPLRSHGNLKSSNCVIDSRWVLKITDFGAVVSYKKPGLEGDPGNKHYYSSLLWCAPEILRMNERPHKGTQKGDVYSFAIILQEIFFRCTPYFYNNTDAEDIVTLVRRKGQTKPYRPLTPSESDCPARATSLMSICWSEEPEARPDFHNVRKRLREFDGHKRFNFMDNMLQMLESYSTNLEVLVNERTEELEAEKRKTDSLLYQMLPTSVAEQLKSGMCVIPEYFDQVSIFFSDIVGFTMIASHSKPLEVVDLLNDLYTCFDEVIARRDVYKVETIGDAYMCVSGCPKKNGPRHAGEIANMALDLISAVTHFRIRHKPEERLNLRIGLHTGPCAAGVVGRTMPRYCLFGDTVNMASRMESTGKALHIHMSSDMKEALDNLDWGFLIVDRGFIDVKGKGLHKTFWLAGKLNYKKPLPETLLALQKSLEDGGNPPTPSYCTLTVGDSMFSALRKSSITISNITVENTPYTSDSEDGSSGAHALDRFYDNRPRSASAIIGPCGPPPQRKHATVHPVDLALLADTATEGSARRNDGILSNNSSSSVLRKDTPGIGSDENKCCHDAGQAHKAVKKDSACYSVSDVSNENQWSCDVTSGSLQDLRKVSAMDVSDIKSEDNCVLGEPGVMSSVDKVVKMSRKKFLARRLQSGDIPRIEIT